MLEIKQSEKGELTLKSLDPREDYLKLEPIEQMVDIQIDQGEGQITKVGSLLNQEQRKGWNSS